jgi:hypothetical protein
MWRIDWNALSQRRMSSRGSNYTRGNRQGKSVGNFPAWESRPRRGMPSLQFGASELTFIGAIELTRSVRRAFRYAACH